MHVVALLSGGKDSVYNLMHCIANGHHVVALATLLPQPGTDELDSYMYQSVGTGLPVRLIARALRRPLVTRVIEGRPVSTALQYGAAERGGREQGVEGDETEDLFELLSEVKRTHPTVDAVASGAILSNYQRTRVEHVAARLGLASLCYLWQRPEAALVREMVDPQRGGMHAVLVKVAGMGLAVEDVGRTLADMRGKLERLERLYNAHVAGEGGEFETTTVDCPVFHERIVFDDTEVVVTDPSPVAYLRVASAHLAPKPDHAVPGPAELRARLGIDDPAAMGMALLDAVSEAVLEGWREGGEEGGEEGGGDALALARRAEDAALDVGQLSVGDGTPEAVARFAQVERSYAVSIHVVNGAQLAFEDEVERVFQQLEDTLHAHALTTRSIQHQNFFLADMALFARANAVYARVFGTAPPSRACVAVDMPRDRRVALEAVGVRPGEAGAAGGREALHVQSLSYWAPANIGPYSQAVMADQRVTIAGQIGLIPSTLALPAERPFAQEAVLSLQHARRIIDLLESPESTGGGYTGWPEGVICWLARAELVRPAREIWRRHTKAWDRPDCPALFVAVRGLPRSARVEWQLSMHTGRPPVVESSYDDEDEEGPKVDRSIAPTNTMDLEEWTRFGPGYSSWAVIGTADQASALENTWYSQRLSEMMSSSFSIRVFALPGVPDSTIEQVLQKHSRKRDEICSTRITCSFIADREGRSLSIAFVLVGK